MTARRTSWIGALVLILLLAGCDGSESDGFALDPYLGTYAGPITASVTFPDGLGTAFRANATATFADLGDGRVRFTLLVEQTGQAPLVYEGTHDAGGMRFQLEQDTLMFDLAFDEDGEADGEGSLQFYGLALDGEADGQLAPERLNLLLDLTVTQGNFNVPEGSTALIQFDGEK